MNFIYFETILKIAMFWTVAVIIPGPSFLFALNTTIQYGKIKALHAVGGMVFGTAIWAVSGLLGINILFILAPWLYKSIKIAGGAYLIYLGLRKVFEKNLNNKIEDARILTNFGHFQRGLMVSLSNPKTAIFISSLFATIVPKEIDVSISIFIILTLILISLTWYLFISVVFSHRKIRDEYNKRKLALNKVSGALFVSLGLKVVLPETASN